MDVPLQVSFHNLDRSEAFEQLEIGGEVRLVVAEGESAQGPQASTVDPLGKHHMAEPPP